ENSRRLPRVARRVIRRLAPVMKGVCVGTGYVCDGNTLAGVSDVLETCEEILCCDRSRCGNSCYQESTERCCSEVDLIPSNECCPDETECPGDGPCVG
ncbi:unnamed protein product, partial [Ectocarpus sp. 12 AP-2014]